MDRWAPLAGVVVASTALLLWLALRRGRDDVTALASVLESESSDPRERVAIAWVALNRAGGLPPARRLYDVVTGGRGYGPQSGGRPFGTSHAPRASALELAERVLAGVVRDPTGGATRFFHPAAQDRLHARDSRRWRPAREVVAKWAAEGYAPRPLDGVPRERFLLFVRARRGVA